LEITDVTGRVLGNHAYQLQAGTNTLDLLGELLPHTGVAFYRLYASGWSAAGKLIRE